MVHQKIMNRYRAMLGIALVVLIFEIILASTWGSADLSAGHTFKIITSKIPVLNSFFDSSMIEAKYFTIVLKIRLPRIILAGFVGMGLAFVGGTFQGVFKNPMADPYVLGISSGAAFGATIGIVINASNQLLKIGITNILAFVFALAAAFLVYNIARVGYKVPTTTLLLSGIAVNYFLQAFISVMMIFNRDRIENIVMWTMGSLSNASWEQVLLVIVPTIIALIVAMSYTGALNAMLLGEEHAQSLGVDTEKVKRNLLIIDTILIACIVSVSGIIGFVGLVVPHAVRLVVGPNHKLLIPFSAVFGAIYLIFCDTLARSLLAPTELPVGAITALFGAPYFIFLLYKYKKEVVAS